MVSVMCGVLVHMNRSFAQMRQIYAVLMPVGASKHVIPLRVRAGSVMMWRTSAWFVVAQMSRHAQWAAFALNMRIAKPAFVKMDSVLRAKMMMPAQRILVVCPRPVQKAYVIGQSLWLLNMNMRVMKMVKIVLAADLGAIAMHSAW